MIARLQASDRPIRRARRPQTATSSTASCQAKRGYKRYLRQTTTGLLRIDRADVTAEERLDGKFLLSTSDPDPPPRTSRSATRSCWKSSAASAI